MMRELCMRLQIHRVVIFVIAAVELQMIPCNAWSEWLISSRAPWCPPVVSRLAVSRCRLKAPLQASVPCLDDSSPTPGRVEDADRWIHLSSESLKQCTGTSLFERLGVTSPTEVHDHDRYAVLSHGVQDDPIYHYFNRAAFATFQFPEHVVYKTPSRYSAPPGPERDVTRARQVDDAVQRDLTIIPGAVRQSYHGDLFRVGEIILWNVYDENGDRVGQTAIYDRTEVEPYEQ